MLRYRIEEVKLGIEDGGPPIEIPRLVLVGEAPEHDLASLASTAGGKDDVREPVVTPRMNAAAWLTIALSNGEWHESKGLKVAAANTGGIHKRTLERAAFEELGVERKQEGFPALHLLAAAAVETGPYTRSCFNRGNRMTKRVPVDLRSLSRQMRRDTTDATDSSGSRARELEDVKGRPELNAGEALLEALRPLVAELVEYEVDRRLAELDRLEIGPRWLTLRQAAARLGCSPDAVRMRARRGRLEHHYQGRRLYVSADAVDRL